MDTIILQCNERYEPDVRSWILEVKQELAAGNPSIWTWSCSNVRRIQVGDRIFLQHTGNPPRGYFASGHTVAAPQEEQLRLLDSSYDDLSSAYHNSFYNSSFKVCFKIDSICDYDAPLQIDYLRSLSKFDDCNFTHYGGGHAFNAEYVDFLEEEWEKYTRQAARRGLGIRLIDSYCSNAAKYLAEQKNYEALEFYSAALDLDRSHIQARIGLGNVLLSLEDFHGAIEEYTRATSVDSIFLKVAYFKRGITYSKLQEYSEAIEDFKKVIEIDPNFHPALLRLGKILLKIEQCQTSIEVYSKAISVNGSIANAFLNRGRAFATIGDLQSAHLDWQTALEIDSTLKETVERLLHGMSEAEEPTSHNDDLKTSSFFSEEQNSTDLLRDDDEQMPPHSDEEYEEIDISNRPTAVSEIEKDALVKARIGQSQFRKDLIAFWQTCAVTGCGNRDLLRASHIKPWSKCNKHEALDPFNGILLMPSLDAAFDSGYISFDDSGQILISDSLSKQDAESLGIYSKLCLSKIDPKHEKYLAYHRQNIFKSCAIVR